MSRDEALTLLGVDADADAQTRKRAYLRRLKQTKPERDPEGFQRLREAYELLEHDSPDDDHEPEPASTPLPPPHEPVTLEPLATPRPSFDELVEQADEAFENRDLDKLLRLLDQALDLTQTEEGLEGPDLPEYLVGSATLAAFVVGDPEPGRALFRRWSKLSGLFDAVRAERDVDEQARLVLVSELVELPSNFPHEFAALIASALVRGDPDGENVRIKALADERPSAAFLARDLLSLHAPGLHRLFSDSFGEDESERPVMRGAEDHPVVIVLYVAAMLIFVLLRLGHCTP
jgi:hypothetical protein